MSKQQADYKRYGKQRKREPQPVRVHKLALSAAGKDEIQSQKAQGGDDRVGIVPALVGRDEHNADETAEQEFEVQYKRAAAEPDYKAALPRRGYKARDCGDQLINKIEDKADDAGKQRAFVDSLNTVVSAQKSHCGKIIIRTL